MSSQAQALRAMQSAARAAGEEFINLNTRLLLARVLAAPIPAFTGSRVRTMILRMAGFHFGPGTIVWGMPTFIGGRAIPANLVTGAQVKIGVRCFFDLGARVILEDNVTLGPEVMLITGGHLIGSSDNRAGPLVYQPIQVGKGCWLGARSIILPGVTIGAGCIIGAGALVNRDVPPNTIVGGVPAKVLREIHE